MARIAELGGTKPRAVPASTILALALAAMAALLWLTPARAEVFGRLTRGAADACRIAIDRIEREANIPAQLLTAIALVESGRADPDTGEKIAWPWTVNNAGDGRYFDTKAEAMDHVRALVRRGQLNIDVGCMQINLSYHPDAFVSLEEAFDPLANVAYAARFLRELRDGKHSWSLAVANYHSATPERGEAYRKKVFDAWTQVRIDRDRQHREAVLAQFQAQREKRAQLAANRPAPPGVTVLRPREAGDRFAWLAGGMHKVQQVQQRPESGPRGLGWYRSNAGIGPVATE